LRPEHLPQALIQGRMREVRQAAIRTFRTRQRKITNPFRLIAKERFETLFPGRIERESLTVKTMYVESRVRDVVLSRRLPDGEWDMDLEEIAGVEEAEDQVAADEIQLRNRQGRHTFEAPGNLVGLSKEETDGLASMDADATYNGDPEELPSAQDAVSEPESDDAAETLDMPSLLFDIDLPQQEACHDGRQGPGQRQWWWQ
jgi:hypothetical protein